MGLRDRLKASADRFQEDRQERRELFRAAVRRYGHASYEAQNAVHGEEESPGFQALASLPLDDLAQRLLRAAFPPGSPEPLDGVVREKQAVNALLDEAGIEGGSHRGGATLFLTEAWQRLDRLGLVTNPWRGPRWRLTRAGRRALGFPPPEHDPALDALSPAEIGRELLFAAFGPGAPGAQSRRAKSVPSAEVAQRYGSSAEGRALLREGWQFLCHEELVRPDLSGLKHAYHLTRAGHAAVSAGRH